MLTRVVVFCLAFVLAPAMRVYAYAVELVFTESTGSGVTGSSVITAAPGDLLTLEVRFEGGEAGGGISGVSSYAIGITFDSDLVDELDLVGATSLTLDGWTVTGLPLPTLESSSTQAGRVGDFGASDSSSAPVGFPSGFVPIGVVQFRVNSSVLDDGPDIVSRTFSGAHICIDGRCPAFCDYGGICPIDAVEFGTASINAAAEPEGFWLLCFGSALVVAKREVRTHGKRRAARGSGH